MYITMIDRVPLSIKIQHYIDQKEKIQHYKIDRIY